MPITNFEVKRGIQTSNSSGNVFSDIVPIGTIALWPTASIPAGWAECNGSTFSSITYPELASVLGNTYGQSSGTTYYLPELEGRVAMGKGTTSNPGDWGGSETINITNAIISHSHGMNSHTHPLNSHTHATTHGGDAHGSSHAHPITPHAHPLGAGGTHSHAMWFANTGAPGTTQPRNNTTGGVGGTISSNNGAHGHTVTDNVFETDSGSGTDSSGDVSVSSAIASASPGTTGAASTATPSFSGSTTISIMQESYALAYIIRVF